MTSATTTRHAVGTVVRITGDTEHHLGRIGEVVSDDGTWYRLRIDNSVAVLFRHQHVEAVTDTAVAHGLRVELRTMHVTSLKTMLDDAIGWGDDAEIVSGLRAALAEARTDLANAEDTRDDARREQLSAELSALSWSRGRQGTPTSVENTLRGMYDRALTEWAALDGGKVRNTA